MAIDLISPAAGTNTGDAADPRLPDTVRRLAQQFESLLLAQMLREMQASTGSPDAGMSFGGPLADTVYSELATALAGAGGFGLAASLRDAMARTTPGLQPLPADAPAAPAGRQRAPWMPPVEVERLLPMVDASRVSSAYGMRRDPISGATRMHRGIDIPMAHGDDVRSVQAGTVIESTVRTAYGNTIVVDHGDGLTTRYAHLSARNVVVGETVRAGQVLGLAGQTGKATGTHLHLEVRAHGVAVDPLGPVAGQLLAPSSLAIQYSAAPADNDSTGTSAAAAHTMNPREYAQDENR